MTPDTLCYSDTSKPLIPFILQINNLEFEEEPDYDHLKFILVKILLESEEVPKSNILKPNPF